MNPHLLIYAGGNVSPPDTFVFVHPEDGWKSKARDMDSWFAAILKHNKDNDYLIYEDWKERAVDQLCRTLPPGWCMYPDGSTPTHHVTNRLNFQDVLRGAKVFVAFVKDGGKLVSQEVAEERALTCSRCPMNMMVQGCGACHGLANLVAEVAGGRETKSDALLHSCAVCHCSNKAQVWMPDEVLTQGITPAMREMFSQVPHCWKKNL